jgi:flagellin-like protein
VTTFTLIKEKKAVSPVIAVVLMVAIAVAITVIVYAWTSGFVSEEVVQKCLDAESIVLESIRLSGTNLIVHIRNKDPSNIVMDAVYVNGHMMANNIDITMNSDSVTLFDLSAIINANGGDGSFQPGDKVKLVTKAGTQIVFDVKR